MRQIVHRTICQSIIARHQSQNVGNEIGAEWRGRSQEEDCLRPPEAQHQCGEGHRRPALIVGQAPATKIHGRPDRESANLQLPSRLPVTARFYEPPSDTISQSSTRPWNDRRRKDEAPRLARPPRNGRGGLGRRVRFLRRLVRTKGISSYSPPAQPISCKTFQSGDLLADGLGDRPHTKCV